MTRAGDIPEGFELFELSTDFGRLTGPFYEKVNADGSWARGFMPVEKHGNSMGVVHGGMIMTFADIVLSRAVRPVATGPFVTLRLDTSFVSPALIGNFVEGRAELVSIAGPDFILKGEISSRGKLVASLNAIFRSIVR